MSQIYLNGQGSLPDTPNIEFVEGNDSVPVGPNPTTHVVGIVGNTTQGVSVTNTAPYTETITVATATTSQKGVVELASNAQAIAGTDTSNAVTSAALAAKLGTQTAHGLAYGAGTASAIAWLGEAQNGYLPIGSTGGPPVLGAITSNDGSATITLGAGTIDISVIGGSANVQYIIGNDSVQVGPNATTHAITLIGNGTQGVSVTNTSANTETITVATATTSQIGVVELASNAQAIAGTDTSNAVTSAALAAKLGTQTAHGLAYGAGTSTAISWLGEAQNGYIPIGSTGNAPVLGPITSNDGSIAVTLGSGTIDLSAQSGTAVTGQTIGAVTANLYTLALGSTPGTYEFSARVSGFNSATPAGCGFQVIAAVRTTGSAATLCYYPVSDGGAESALSGVSATFVVTGNSAVLQVTGMVGLTVDWGATISNTFRS